MIHELWTIIPLQVGLCHLGEDHLLGDVYSAEKRVPFAMYAFLLRCGQRVVLVDLGPESVEFINDMFHRYGFFRPGPDRAAGPDDTIQPQGNIFTHLQRLAIDPAQITDIVLTHLHADHHGMDWPDHPGALTRFPQARVHISARGWQANLDSRCDGRWNSYVDHVFSDHLAQRLEAGQACVADDAPIAPGLRTCYLGGHAPCSQAVLVETVAGTAIITSDEIYSWDLLARKIVARLHTSVEQYQHAVHLLVGLAEAGRSLLLPMHDPMLWELYCREGENWLTAAAQHSQQAIDAFLARQWVVAGQGRHPESAPAP
jgi:glyoxylase-like metal-dependent hydrolase (beta-lactamase superfamily II)